jgi:hypothetical protein
MRSSTGDESHASRFVTSRGVLTYLVQQSQSRLKRPAAAVIGIRGRTASQLVDPLEPVSYLARSRTGRLSSYKVPVTSRRATRRIDIALRET